MRKDRKVKGRVISVMKVLIGEVKDPGLYLRHCAICLYHFLTIHENLNKLLNNSCLLPQLYNGSSDLNDFVFT